MTPRDFGLTLLVVTIWGANFVAIKWGVDEVPPLLLSALRFLAAAVPAVFFIRRPRVAFGILVAYGFAIGVMQFGLLFVAIKLGMPAGLSSLVMQLQAFFTIGLAVVLLGERLHPAQWLGGLLAFGGIALIGVERMQEAALLPLLMTIAASLFWGIGNIVTKKAGQIDMLAFVVWSSLVPPIPLFLLSLLIEGPGALPQALDSITWRGGFSLLFIAYGSTLLGYGLWSMLLSRYPANTVAPFTLLVPVTGMGSAYLLLGETVSGMEIAGSIVVFLGLACNGFGPRLWRRWRPGAVKP